MVPSFLLHKTDVADRKWEPCMKPGYMLANGSPGPDCSIPGSLDVPRTGLKWPRMPSSVPRTSPRCLWTFQAPRTQAVLPRIR
jgi:hypothetical protein